MNKFKFVVSLDIEGLDEQSAVDTLFALAGDFEDQYINNWNIIYVQEIIKEEF